MKNIISAIFSFVMFVTMTACGNMPNEETQTAISETVNNMHRTVTENETGTSENTEVNMDNKTLVVYFSCTGTTKQFAGYAAEILGADIYEIQPKIPYTEDDLAYYTDCRADREQNDPKARPAISGSGFAVLYFLNILFILQAERPCLYKRLFLWIAIVI